MFTAPSCVHGKIMMLLSKWIGGVTYILLFQYYAVIQADFIYEDFNQTLGLNINGDADTSGCQIDETYIANNADMNSTVTIGKGNDIQSKQTVVTNQNASADDIYINELEAQFGHRDVYSPSLKDGCKRRLRLTPASRSKVGSVFYNKRVPVVRGFDTIFSFQITDHSKVCSYHVETMASLKHHRSCAVHGGDGLAFVIHSDEAGAYAIGRDGQGLGYAGISNSLAIEFDTWTNVDTQGSDDLFFDHIAIHSASTGENSDESTTKLGQSRPVDLADGKVHVARIQYLPYIEEKYMEAMTANENLLPYIKDNGEGRRLGTLAVFIDDDVKVDKPILAIPLNLSVLLDFPQSLAYVGFTGSTGVKWENHDIIDWHWCDSVHCQGDLDEAKRFEINI